MFFKINREIQRNCNAQCHQACNDLTTNQTRHAKSCRPTITWKCPQHDTGITDIIIPPSPVFELPSRSSAAGKLCSVCNNPTQSCCADLAYHCDASSCANVCHFSATCSGFVNLRGTTRAGFYSNLALSSAVFTNGKWAFINPT